MKKAIITIISAVAFITMTAEADSAFAQIVVTGISAFVLYLCGKALGAFTEEQEEA